MKKIKIIIFFLFISLNALSQISVGRTHKGPFKDLKKEDYKAAKERTTLFVLDDFEVKEFDNMLKSFWNISKYEIATREQFDFREKEFKSGNYTIFEFGGEVVTMTSQSGMVTEFLYLNHNLYYCTDVTVNKKGKLKYDYNELASIYFSGDANSMWEIIDSKTYGKLTEQLYNYQLGYMKNYLQFIHNCLKDDWYSFAFSSTYDKKKIKVLKNTTLYVPDYIKIQYSGWKGTDKERENPDELFEDYKSKYQWISSEELNNKILNTTENFYYLMYTKVNSMKMVSVVNGKTGEVIYTDYQSLSYQLKPKDLKEIYSKFK